jgi:hypothetical protein
MDLLGSLSTAIAELSQRHQRVVVGIDGPDCAGKTTVADKLARALQAPSLELPTVRASVDGFSRPRAQRYERGELSAEGYYLDSFEQTPRPWRTSWWTTNEPTHPGSSAGPSRESPFPLCQRPRRPR